MKRMESKLTHKNNNNKVTVYNVKHDVFIRAPRTTCHYGNECLTGPLWELGRTDIKSDLCVVTAGEENLSTLFN